LLRDERTHLMQKEMARILDDRLLMTGNLRPPAGNE
jgi:hypothetical protein